MSVPPTSDDVFAERQWPPFATWILAPSAGLLSGLVTFPISLGAGVATFGVVTITLALLLARTADRIVVTDGADPGLRAGGAFLEAWHIGEVTPLDAEQTRLWLGPRADARAFLAHRGWIPTSVRVEVRDESDPTPYWLISSRRGDDMAAALNAIRPPVP